MFPSRKSEPYAPVWLSIGFWACILISIAVVIRRLVALAFPLQSGTRQATGLDQVFASRASLTLAHILPALALVLIIPFAVMRRFSRFAWLETALFPLAIVVGLTAYAMSADAIGGWTERTAVMFYNSLFLFCIARAWQFRQDLQPAQKRRSLIRAIAILFGIATTRPVMALFFATSSLTHLTPQQFFGIAFWMGFSINWIAIEVWLHKVRKSGEIG